MAALNLDLDYFSHLKTKRLVATLGNGADVLPIRLWVHCAKHHAEDGILHGYADSELENILGWWGEQGVLVGVLIRIGWIERIEDGFRVHDWLEHEGHIAAFKKRSVIANRKRWKGLVGVQQGVLKRKRGSPPTIPNHTIPKKKIDKTRPSDIDAVIQYMKEIAFEPADEKAALWWDHHEANGWKVGRAGLPMKDWKAVCRTWKRNNFGGLNGRKENKKGNSQLERAEFKHSEKDIDRYRNFDASLEDRDRELRGERPRPDTKPRSDKGDVR